MHASDHRALSPSQPNSFNLLLSLKEKKKQLLNCEKSIKQRIKQFYSDLTLMLHDKETATLEQFDNKLCQVFENIDSFCAMTETDRYQNRIQIFKILGYKLDITDQNKLKDVISDSILGIGFEDEESNRTTGLEHVKTSKKGHEKNHVILKQAYLEQITYLEEKIEKLALKEDKIKARLAEMESRQKMKKVGTSYLPYQEKVTSNLLIERLESENKILINQIAQSSQKILELRSENSMLARDSQLMPTEKKKMCQSINIIQESIELSHYQEKVNQLQTQIEQLKQQIQAERNSAIVREEQFHLTNERVIAGYQQKIRDLTDYKERLENQCDSLQSKKMELQSKLSELQAKHTDLSMSLEVKMKENDNLKELNSNYGKLLQIKEDKIVEAQAAVRKLETRVKQGQDNYKLIYVENAQKMEGKQVVLKSKQAEIQSLKFVLKKQQNEKSEMRQKMTIIQEQLYNTEEKIKSLENDIAKANKDKDSYAKKEVIKAKKQWKKNQEDEKVSLMEDFKVKYGEFMEKLDSLKKQYNDNMEKSDKKVKLYESRMEMLKDKVAFQTKEMLEKLSKPGQKQKLFIIVQSYIQSEASLTMKNAQIKILKQEVAGLKKPVTKKQISKPVGELEVVAELQQFQKKMFIEKLELQKQIYQTRILQQIQEHSLVIQQKQSIIQSLNARIQVQDKNMKEMKSQLSAANTSTNPEISQLKKINDQMTERGSKMEGQISGLKNNITKLSNELLQVKQELKLKKELITGLKKELKDKELEKSKLNETVSSLIQQSEKLKRTSKEANKKQAIFTEFKQKLINQTELSQQIYQLKNNMEEKQKAYRIQLNKKDQIIKQLKINDQICNKKLKSMTNLEEEVFDLKQKIKKLKIEVDRKDTLIEHLKEKQQKTSNQLVSANENTQNQLKRTKKQLESQRSRGEALKAKLNKMQTNYQLLKLSMMRIYEQASQSSSIHKEYQTNTTKAGENTRMKTRYEFTNERTPEIDVNKYRQALSILELSSEDLELTSPINGSTKIMTQYNSPSINKMCNSTQNFNQESIKLSKLLDCEDIDSKAIIEIFTYVMEQ